MFVCAQESRTAHISFRHVAGREESANRKSVQDANGRREKSENGKKKEIAN